MILIRKAHNTDACRWNLCKTKAHSPLLLMIPCTTIRTAAFTPQCMTTISANEGCAVFCSIAIEGKEDVGHQQQIANVIERKDAEDNIVNGTHADQSADVKYGLACWQLMEGVIYGGNSNDEHCPHRRKEDGEQRWNRTRV